MAMEITRARLQEMYDSMTIEEMRSALGGVCTQTIYNLLKRAGIKKKRNLIRHNVKLEG